MEEKKNSKLGLGIIIGLLIAAVVGLGTFIVYDKVINKKSDANSDTNVTNPTNTIADEKDLVDITNTNQLILNWYNYGTYKYKVKLNGKFRKLEITINDEGNASSKISYKMDDKIFSEHEVFAHNGSNEFKLMILNKGIIVIAYDNNELMDNIQIYDENLNKIKYDYQEELHKVQPEMDVMTFWNSNFSKSVQVVENKISFFATRATNPFSFDGIMYNGEKISDYNQLCTDEKYKNIVMSSRYEIEYLGNGKFSEMKIVSGSDIKVEEWCKN